MKSSRLHQILGVFVLTVAGFAMLATTQLSVATEPSTSGFQVIAHFNNVGAMRVDAPVTMAGVPIGRVEAITLDGRTFEAKVVMRIDAEHKTIPADSSASILTIGLVGDQYVALEPGGAEVSLADGSAITITQSAVILEQVIGQIVYKQGGG